MWTKNFWKATAERAISTGAQFVVTLAGVEALNWVTLDWGQIGIAAGIGAGLSVLKSLAVAGVTDGSPSVGNVEVVKPLRIDDWPH